MPVAADDPRDGHGDGARGDWRPIPDPTTLTTEQLRRELSALREILTARLDGMDRATTLLSETVNRTPTVIQTEIKHLRELSEEKFDSVALQFQERDVRTAQASGAADDALKAALQAAKELVGAQGDAAAAAAVKTETSFTKQIDQIATIISTLEKAMDARITELKERIDRGEGSSAGVLEHRTEARLNVGQVMSVVAAAIAAVSAIVAIIIATRPH
jgi:hypothetical protein